MSSDELPDVLAVERALDDRLIAALCADFAAERAEAASSAVVDFDANEAQLMGGSVGAVVDAVALAAVSRVVRTAHSRYKTPLPVLSATEDGGVLAEWLLPPWRIVGEIEPGISELSMFVVHVDNRRPVFRAIDTSRLDAADEVAALVAYAGGPS